MFESDLPQVGYNPDVWLGIFAPPDTPPAVIGKLNTEINESLKSAGLKATLAKLGFEPKVATPQEFRPFSWPGCRNGRRCSAPRRSRREA